MSRLARDVSGEGRSTIVRPQREGVDGIRGVPGGGGRGSLGDIP